MEATYKLTEEHLFKMKPGDRFLTNESSWALLEPPKKSLENNLILLKLRSLSGMEIRATFESLGGIFRCLDGEMIRNLTFHLIGITRF